MLIIISKKRCKGPYERTRLGKEVLLMATLYEKEAVVGLHSSKYETKCIKLGSEGEE